MDNNSSIYSLAKIEYTKQLIDILTQHLFDGIKSIYDESKIVFSQQTTKSVLTIFRLFLEKIPIWNNSIIESETYRIIESSKCDWLDDLITAVFISHTKILTSIGPNSNNIKIDLTIPKTINFIHKCYINLAREIWKNPYLFDDNIKGHEYQKNINTIEIVIKESIETTIRKLLPIKDILKTHLLTYDNENNEEIKKISEDLEIKKLLLQEIKNLKNQNNKIQTNDDNDNHNHNDNDNDIENVKDIENDNDNDNENENDKDIENDNDNENDNGNKEMKNIVTITKMEANNDNNVKEILPSDDGYFSPDENDSKEKCNNIEINDIPDITEEKYNVDILNNDTKYDNFLNKVDSFNIDKVNESSSNVNDLLSNLHDNKYVLNNELENKSDKLENNKFKNNIWDNFKSSINSNNEKISLNQNNEIDATFINKDIKNINDVNINKVNSNKVELTKLDDRVELTKLDENKVELTKLDDRVELTKLDENKVELTKLDENKVDDNKVDENKVEFTKVDDNRVELTKVDENKQYLTKVDNIDKNNNILKEVMTIEKNKVDDDLETMDNFFNDVSSLMEKKGVNINKSNNLYTLFDDAVENE
jgi:hypothetical protein